MISCGLTVRISSRKARQPVTVRASLFLAIDEGVLPAARLSNADDVLGENAFVVHADVAVEHEMLAHGRPTDLRPIESGCVVREPGNPIPFTHVKDILTCVAHCTILVQ